jgi:hypothetical protein
LEFVLLELELAPQIDERTHKGDAGNEQEDFVHVIVTFL